jgi:ankyrin repeat protein
MEVCSLASGATLAEFDIADVEGKSARALKSMLAAKLRIPRFRQRFFSEDGSQQIEDDEVFGADPMKLKVLLLEFWPCDEEEDEKMISACRRNDSEALEKLLQQPRDPNAENEGGFTPLHHAAEWGHVELVRLLVDARADIEYKRSTAETPLHLAAQEGQLDVVRLLVDLGANLEETTNECGSTALHLAAEEGHLDVARFLVEVGANKDQPRTSILARPCTSQLKTDI